MRTMQENKAEIFRRVQQRKEERKAVRRRITAVVTPMVLVVGLVCLLLSPYRPESEEAQPDTYTEGSIVCTYVRAEIYAGDAVWTVTDKVAVTKIFHAVYDNGKTADGGDPSAGAAEEYRILLVNEDGTSTSFSLSAQQWRELGLEGRS